MKKLQNNKKLTKIRCKTKMRGKLKPKKINTSVLRTFTMCFPWKIERERSEVFIIILICLSFNIKLKIFLFVHSFPSAELIQVSMISVRFLTKI
jgi:hypothetical protein